MRPDPAPAPPALPDMLRRDPPGSRLWRALVPRQTTDAESFRREARARAFGKVVRVRLLMAPVFATVALTFSFFEPTPGRRVALSGVLGAFGASSGIEWARYRRRGLGAFMVPLNLLVMSIGQAIIVLATGGLFSPIFPVLVIMVLVVSLFLGRAA